jgi:hypothetical protein
MGIHGVDNNEKYILCVYRADDPGIIIFDSKTLKKVCSHVLPGLSDPHGLAVIDDEFIVTSTGNDQVFRYRMGSDLKQIKNLGNIWTPEGSNGSSDEHHINSACSYNGEIFVSAFGPKKGKLWSTAEDGYIYNISKHRKVLGGIYHPHSLTVNRRGYFYCDSSRRRVMRGRRVILRQEAGYTRGLAVTDKYYIVGSSNGRTQSKSTGIKGKEYISNIADPGILQKCCKVSVYRKSLRVKLESEYDFTGDRNEIFKILVLED